MCTDFGCGQAAALEWKRRVMTDLRRGRGGGREAIFAIELLLAVRGHRAGVRGIEALHGDAVSVPDAVIAGAAGEKTETLVAEFVLARATFGSAFHSTRTFLVATAAVVTAAVATAAVATAAVTTSAVATAAVAVAVATAAVAVATAAVAVATAAVAVATAAVVAAPSVIGPKIILTKRGGRLRLVRPSVVSLGAVWNLDDHLFKKIAPSTAGLNDHNRGERPRCGARCQPRITGASEIHLLCL